MENQVTIFSSEQFGEIRTVMTNGEPHFVAADVCKALEIGNPTMALGRLDDDESTLISIEGTSSGGNPNVNVVTESGLYSLVLGSRKPEAKQFKRWITHDVIPSIRKTGGFVQAGKESDFIEHYFPSFSSEVKLAMVKDLYDQNQKLKEEKNVLTEKVENAETENKVLAGKNLTWDKRRVFNRLMDRYAEDCCKWNWGKATYNVRTELRINYHIDLAKRKSERDAKTYIDCLDTDVEWNKAIVSLCSLMRSNDVKYVDIVNRLAGKVDKEAE